MSGRVSIKGQGAEIFFGETAGGSSKPQGPSAPLPESEDTRDAVSAPPESKPASKPAGQLAGQQDSLQASKPASTSSPKPTGLIPLDGPGRQRLLELLEREHRTHNTYRYHSDELAAVRDIVYELEVRWRVKVTRNDVMRAAILWAIQDYKERGQDSFLVQLFRKEERRQ